MSRGLVGIIANDAARFSEFSACVTQLEAPEGWSIDWAIGGDWCGARNNLMQLALEGDYTHLWFMDDDHSFSPDILVRLLAHDKPLINPLCLTRTFPFVPCIFPKKLPQGEHVYLPMMNDADPETVIEIEAGGCAGMLIRRDVLEAVAALPGRAFEYGDRSEDIIFCEKAKACGFTLYADLSVRLGHITTAVVWPSWEGDENGWMTGLTIGKEMKVNVSFWSQLLAQQTREREEEVAEAVAAALPTSPAAPPAPDQPPDREDGYAERIEIWIDDELRWWWRAINDGGEVIARDSAIREDLVIAAGQRAYPDAPIHQIPNELADSRNLTKYGPPVRLWNRGN